MLNVKLGFIAAAVVLFLASGSFALAEQRSWQGKEEKGGSEMMEKKAAKMEAKLGLTDEQRTKMKAFREEHKGKMKALMQKMKVKKQELRTVLDADTLDRAKAQSLTNELKNLFGQIADLRLEMVFKAHDVLTPEQRKKMKDFRQEHKKQWQEKGKQKGEMRGKHGKGSRGMHGQQGEESSEQSGAEGESSDMGPGVEGSEGL